VRKVLRGLLMGETVCILEGGVAVRTRERCDCLRKRLRRLCAHELGFTLLCDVKIEVTVYSTIVRLLTRELMEEEAAPAHNAQQQH